MNRKYPRVLLIDDDESVVQVLRRLFELWRWDTRKAHDCARALAYLESDERFDMIVLDLILPDCPGDSILTWVREHDYPAKVIVSTGKSPEDCDDVRALKPDMLATKPYFIKPIEDMAEDIYVRFFQERRARLVVSIEPAESEVK